MTDHTIRELQTNLPWTVRYSHDFRSNPQSHKDFAHALHHASKAMGRLHELADELGMKEGALKTAIHRLRRRYAALVRAEIAETVSDPDDVEEEVQHLFRSLE